MTELKPVLPEFPFWKAINPRRKLVDNTSRKKWYLPDTLHYMEIFIRGDRIHMHVVREGYGDIVLEYNFWLHDKQGYSLLNIGAVLADKRFCREDPIYPINRYKAGN